MVTKKGVKTRKKHQCYGCGKDIDKGSIVNFRKLYPKQATSWGMIDVSTPVSMYFCRSTIHCGKPLEDKR